MHTSRKWKMAQNCFFLEESSKNSYQVGYGRLDGWNIRILYNSEEKPCQTI